jgi:hypothetical protein
MRGVVNYERQVGMDMEGIDPGPFKATVTMFAWKYRTKPRKTSGQLVWNCNDNNNKNDDVYSVAR